MFTYHRDVKNLGVEHLYWRGFRGVPNSDVHRIARFMLRAAWSPVIFQGGVRHQKNFVCALWCVLDFDDGLLSLDQAINNVFADCVRIIGTTKSHQKEKGGITCDRFRVLLRFERLITDLAEYRATMTHYINQHGADPACKDGARFFWPCTEIVDIADDGYEMAVVPPPPPRALKDYSLYRENGAIPRWIEGILRFGCPDGLRNTTCFKLGIYLTKCGFSEDEIVARIMRSPIPIGPHVLREVEAAVKNGAARGLMEMAHEGKEEEKEKGSAVASCGGDQSLCPTGREAGS